MLEKVIIQCYLDDLKNSPTRYDTAIKLEQYIHTLESELEKVIRFNVTLRKENAELNQLLKIRKEQDGETN